MSRLEFLLSVATSSVATAAGIALGGDISWTRVGILAALWIAVVAWLALVDAWTRTEKA